MIFDFLHSRIESPFNIGLSTKSGVSAIIFKYLNNILQQLSKDLNLAPNFIREIQFEKIFTDIEFNKRLPDENEESFINKFFYPNVFNDIVNLEIGKSNFQTKICFTLDKTLTPVKSISGLAYGTLNLGGKPVLYYIWADIQEVINVIKSAS